MNPTVYVIRDANGDVDTVFTGRDMHIQEYMQLQKRVSAVGHYLEMFSGHPVADLEKRIEFIEKEVNS